MTQSHSLLITNTSFPFPGPAISREDHRHQRPGHQRGHPRDHAQQDNRHLEKDRPAPRQRPHARHLHHHSHGRDPDPARGEPGNHGNHQVLAVRGPNQSPCRGLGQAAHPVLEDAGRVDPVPEAVAVPEADLLNTGHPEAAGGRGQDVQLDREVLEGADAAHGR